MALRDAGKLSGEEKKVIAIVIGTIIGTLGAALTWEWIRSYAAERRRKKQGFGRKERK